MLVIRETFVAKPGQASRLARLVKDALASEPNAKMRVMTDFTGDFNRVVLETGVKDLAEFEERMQEYMNDPARREKMKGYTELYLTGKREIFQVWD